MRNDLKNLRVLVSLLLLLTVCGPGCRQKAPQGGDANQPAPAPNEIEITLPVPDVNRIEQAQPPEVDPNAAAVTVDGVKITEGQIAEQIGAQVEAMKRKSGQLPPQFVAQFKEQLRGRLIEKMIAEQLLDREVKLADIEITDQQILDSLTEVAAEQDPPLSLDEFRQLLERRGQNFDELKALARKSLAYQKLLEIRFGDKLVFTEQDAQQFYSANKARFEIPEQVRASHILIVPDENEADPNEARAKAMEKALGLLKQLKDGADFAELAKAHSACPSSARGGDLDFFKRGVMTPLFEKSAFELEIGRLSDIVETRFGYHIIKVTDRKAAETISFEDAKDNIMEQLKQMRLSELAMEYVGLLKSQAEIVYPPGKEPTPTTPDMPTVN